MKIDRRSFLSFAIGGAAGTALSPLPWKLIDDLSIWSQNWDWTPVPENGAATYVKSACTLCPGGCGISVRRVDDRVVKIEGLVGHPVNDGGICPLGQSGPQLLYGPNRVQTPKKKVDGRWHNISWKAAIEEIAEKLSDLRANGLSHTVACISDADTGTIPELWNRLLTTYGSPNFIRTPSIQDNYELALYLTQGVPATAGFDVQNCDYILSFGSGLIEGWESPVFMLRGKSTLVQNNGKMGQIEPRLSKTAAKSDKWIAAKPGTEGALALGISHVIISEGLYNQEFVAKYTAGFGAYKKLVMDGFSPSAVSKKTGVDTEMIVALARDFTRARRPLAICGRGAGKTPGSLQDFMAVHMLNALVGNLNKPGGITAVPVPDYIDWPEVEMDEIAAKGLQQDRIDGAGRDKYTHARYLLDRLPEVVNESQETPLQVLFVSGANPVYSTPDTEAVIKAFEKIPLIISFSSYMDETAAQADLILPNHIYLERFEDVPIARGFPKPVISLTQPVVNPLYDTRNVGDVIIQLAQKLGGSIAAALAWDDYATCLKDTLADHWETLIEKGYQIEEGFPAAQWVATFETDSAKFEFSNSAIKSLPDYRPVPAFGDESFFPLVLIPYDSMRLASGYIGSPPFLVKSLEDTILKGNDVLVEVNPATAKKLGLSDGNYASLTTPKGSARVKVHYFNGIMPDVIAIPRGLGHTAYDHFLAGKGVNYNALTQTTPDPATGFDAAWGIRAKLSRT
ncbi:MAG: molybdopterin-dependent oxidoreductase [Deltaproteobacteria bacterium]|jgi:anaerobic selenocysteine-containing dehydrogenase|nr:molybdopterin-dependent oxidoreductase [Deltaproteobacteria bacterium]